MSVPLIGQSEPTPEEPGIVEAETAFLVFVARDKDGILRTLLTTDINAPVSPAHTASMDEVLAAMAVVQSDISAGKTAEAVAIRQQMAMRAAMENQAHQRVLESMHAQQPARR